MKKVRLFVIPAAIILVLAVGSLVVFKLVLKKNPADGRVVFVSSRNMKASDTVIKTELYMIKSDGTDEKRLTDDQAEYRNPVLSPDGKKILFVQNKALFTMDADGLGRLKVADNGELPQYSPDGKKIAFIRVLMNRDYRLNVMGSEGENKKELAAGYITQVGWSPDGKWLIYTLGRSGEEGTASLHLIKPDGSEDHSFPAGYTGDAQSASFSPDGKKVVFGSFDTDVAGDIYIADIEKGTMKKLEMPKSVEVWKYLPKWSPDGKHIAFLTSDVQPWNSLKNKVNIIVTDTEGKKPVNLTKFKANRYASDIEWISNGSGLLFTMTKVDKKKGKKDPIISMDLYLVTLTGKLSKLTKTGRDVEGAWFGR